jgi:hypothetical protein
MCIYLDSLKYNILIQSLQNTASLVKKTGMETILIERNVKICVSIFHPKKIVSEIAIFMEIILTEKFQDLCLNSQIFKNLSC